MNGIPSYLRFKECAGHVRSPEYPMKNWYRTQLSEGFIIKSKDWKSYVVPVHLLQYIPRNMHTGFALLCFVMVIHWLIFPYPSGLLHWHCGNLAIAPVPAKQPWWIWINTSCEFIMNDCITTTKQAQQNRVHISWDILYIYYLNNP